MQKLTSNSKMPDLTKTLKSIITTRLRDGYSTRVIAAEPGVNKKIFYEYDFVI